MEQYQDKNSIAQLPVLDRTQGAELAAEFVLPDYRSEISRLLLVRPTITPPEIFLGARGADLTGTVRYEVLYVGPDGRLRGVELTDGYRVTVPVEHSAEGTPLLLADVTPDAVVGRVTGPRKLSLRTRIHTRLQGYCEKELAARMTSSKENAACVCRLCDVRENGRIACAERETLALTDSMECGEDVSVISARGCVFLPDVNAGNGVLLCRGELLVTLLLCREEDGIPYTVLRRIPFSTELQAPSVAPDHAALATGSVSELHADVEGGLLSITATVLLVGEAQCEESVLLCRDAFLPGHTAERRYAESSLWRTGACGNRHLSLSESRDLTSLGLYGDEEIIDAAAEAEIAEKVADGARFSLSGDLKCHLLYRRGEEYGVADAALPFRLTLEDMGRDACIRACVPTCRVTATGDTLRVDAELQLEMRSATPAPTESLSEVEFTPAASTSSQDALEIYYPASHETLWDVAKRYGRAPAELAEANGLDADAPAAPESLGGKAFLLIP